MRGRRNPDKPIGNANLPPCRVCGEPGTGFHYGVTTCGACKGFFRRSLTRDEPYVCSRNHLCHVGPSTSRRQSCPKCRYNKCVALGMSREACKVGRYSLLKKSKDMEEVLVTKHHPQIPYSIEQLYQHQPDYSYSTPTSQQFNPAANGNYLDGFQNEHTMSDTKPKLSPNEDECVFGFPEENQPQMFSFGQNNDNRDSDESFNHFEETRTESKCLNNYFFMNSTTYTDDTSDHAGNIMNNETIDNKNFVSTTVKESFDALSEPCYTVLESPPNHNKVSSWIDSNRAIDTTPFYSNFNQENQTSVITSFNRHSPITNSPPEMATQPPNSLNFTPHIPSSEQSTCINRMPNFLDLNHEYNCSSSDSLPNNEKQLNQFSVISSQQQSSPSSSATLYSPEINNSPIENNILANMVSNSPPTSSSIQTKPEPSTNHINMELETKTEYFDFSEHGGYVNNGSSANTVKQPFNYSNECSELDGNNMCSNEDMFKDFENLSSTINNTTHTPPTRFFCGDVEENAKPIVKQQCSPPPSAVQRNSEKQISRTKPKSVVPLFKGKDDKGPNSLFLFVVAPDPMRFALSIYNCFPFKCYERESLAPLLSHCYAVNDSVNEYMPQSWVELMKQDNETRESILSISTGDSFSHLSCILSTAQSSVKRTYKPDLTYDEPEMDELFGRLEEVHCQHFGPKSSYMTDSAIKEALDMFWGICQLKDKLQGSMNFIDDDKYFKILKTTGIDVDKRKEWFGTYLDDFDASFIRDVKFFRDLPGFKDICLKDRIELSKCSLPYFKIMRGARSFDLGKLIAIDQERRCAIRLSTLVRVVPHFEIIFNSWCEIASNLNDLDLTFDEMILFKALVIMMPEIAVTIEEPEVVSSWHNTYKKCLLRLVRRTNGPGPQADERFQRMMGVLDIMKTFQEPLNNFRYSSSQPLGLLSEGHDVPLFKEVFFINTDKHKAIMTA